MERAKWDRYVERLVAFGVDRWIHIVLIMLCAWIVSVSLIPYGLGRVARGLAGVLAGVVISIGKELYDKKTTGFFDVEDLKADCIGLLLFLAIHVI